MSSPTTVSDYEAEPRANVMTYVVGFVLSVLLTLLAFWLVVGANLPKQTALLAIGGLAILQFAVQVLCFLHLGGERKPRNKLLAFVSMLTVVIILVAGSLWIMDNLNYHGMTPAEQSRYLNEHEGF